MHAEAADPVAEALILKPVFQRDNAVTIPSIPGVAVQDLRAAYISLASELNHSALQFTHPLSLP